MNRKYSALKTIPKQEDIISALTHIVSLSCYISHFLFRVKLIIRFRNVSAEEVPTLYFTAHSKSQSHSGSKKSF